jgi:hypothetical protein
MASDLSNWSSKALFPHVTQNYSFAHKRRRITPRRALTPRLVAATTAAKGGFYSEGADTFVISHNRQTLILS